MIYRSECWTTEKHVEIECSKMRILRWTLGANVTAA